MLVSAAKKHYLAKTDFLLLYNKFKLILKSHLKFVLFLLQNFDFFFQLIKDLFPKIRKAYKRDCDFRKIKVNLATSV